MAWLTRTVQALNRLDDRVLFRGGRTPARSRTTVGIAGLLVGVQSILWAAADYQDFVAGFVQGVIGGASLGIGVVLLIMARQERTRRDP
jgi:hypothetical protein